MNYGLLKEEMEKKNVSYEVMSEYLGIHVSTFYRKIEDQTKPFSINQVNLMKEKLELTERKAVLIFLK